MLHMRQPSNFQADGMNLTWDRNFSRERNTNFSDIQKYIDSECIRLMAQYTPMQTGMLQRNAITSIRIGTGKIAYNSPYAHYQYYGKLMVSSVTGSAWARYGESKVLTGIDLNYSKRQHPKAQKLWFETMKTNHKQQILRGAAAISRRR
ncbi:MAG: minor capsid protein [Muribaculaceae bacterium]|nr:minor capsid protein [Alistipes senegalensis]MCM1474483.1 minor capsid protein [Muribaculaceae bacterium]